MRCFSCGSTEENHYLATVPEICVPCALHIAEIVIKYRFDLAWVIALAANEKLAENLDERLDKLT